MKKFITLEITKEVDGSVEEVKEIPGMMEMMEHLKEKGWEIIYESVFRKSNTRRKITSELL